MATTYYTNKSGSDANNGTTPTLAKLTVQAGLTLCASGDTLIVGSGFYNERATYTSGTRTILADGVVTMDGTGLGNGGALFNTSNAATTLTVGSQPSGGLWIFQNYTTTGNANPGTNGTANCVVYVNILTTAAASLTVYDCLFFATGTQWALQVNAFSQTSFLVYNCIFSGFSYGIASFSNNSQALVATAYNNTFYNCTTAYYCRMNGIMGQAYQNIFHTCITSINRQSALTNAAISSTDNNYHYNVTNLGTLDATSYTSLSTWQSASGQEANSTTSNPNLADPANKDFFLTSQISQYPTVDKIGKYMYSLATSYTASSDWTITGTADNTGWYNADGNITKVSSLFQLTSGTSGVIVSPVYDLGAISIIAQVNLVVNQVWGTNMIDYDKTDIRPNYQTIRVRASASSFNQDDGSVTWTEVKTEQDFSPLSGRYVQVELTFRSDDVAA